MRGWYGDKQAHALASKGIRTKAKGEQVRKPFYVEVEGGLLIRSGYNSTSLNDIYEELLARQNLNMLPDYWEIRKTSNGILVTIPDLKKETLNMKILLRDLGVDEFKSRKYIDNGKVAKIDTIKKRKTIDELKAEIQTKELIYNKLRRGLAEPEDFGYEDITKKSLMSDLEDKLLKLRTQKKIVEKELNLIRNKKESLNTKSTKKEKSIYNVDKYHNRRQ